MRLPALLLLAATLLFWSGYDRYEAAGPRLLKSPLAADATRIRGACSETNGIFTLRVPASGPIASMNFRLPGAVQYDQIRVRGRIKVEGVVEGKYSWRCARLLLIQYNEKNRWIPAHHGLFCERGTKDWVQGEDVFDVVPGAAHVDVVIQQSGTAGTAWFDNVEARPVKLRSSFAWWRTLFAVLWLAAAVFYYPRCRLSTRRLRVLIVLNAIGIVVGSLMPGAWLEEGAELAQNAVAELRKPTPSAAAEKTVGSAPPRQVKAAHQEARQIDRFNLSVGSVHKAGHFALFAALCFLVYCSAALEHQGRFYFLKVGFDVLLFAAITETLQYLTMDRTPGWYDLLTDVCGMAAAFIVFLCVLPILRPRGR